MAVKDHTLDEKIVKAAKEEFLQHGFSKASLRQIAKNAGLSTGALYTRYENKDELFASLVKDMFSEIGVKSEEVGRLYMEAGEARDVEKFLAAIRMEEEMYRNLLFEYYDDCILLFCKSEGSKLWAMMEERMEQKAKGTVEYFQSISKQEVDASGIELIMSEQLHYYRKVLLKGYDREKALSCMKEVERFLESGWKEFFERIL